MRQFCSRICVFIFASLAFPVWLAAQTIDPTSPTPQPSPVRDQKAIATIQTAIAAMGGVSNISAISSSTVQGTAQDDSGASTTFTWVNAGSDFRYEVVSADGGHILVSNSGSPQDLRNGSWIAVPLYTLRSNLPFHFPALVLASAVQHQNWTLRFIGPTTVNGAAAIQVHVSDDSDLVGAAVTPQDWYFDPNSGLPVKVRYRIPSEGNPKISSAVSMSFAKWSIISGVCIPFQIISEWASFRFTATVSSATLNAAIPQGTFAASGAQ